MATKGTFHQKQGDIGRIDWMMADAINQFANVHQHNFCVIINALEHYREALVNDVLVEVNAKGKTYGLGITSQAVSAIERLGK